MLVLNDTERGVQSPVSAVIFDLDGTLIDTVEIYFRILETVMKRLGVPAVSRDAMVEASEGGDFRWAQILPEQMRTRMEEIMPQIYSILRDISFPLFQEGASLIPGAENALRTIAEAGFKIGLVTSSPNRLMPAKLVPIREAGVEGCFQATVTMDDTAHKKPSPEPLLECARRLCVEPDRSVYVGDTRSDIIAGRAAGMITVGVLTGFDDYSRLRSANPDMILPSVRELKERLSLRTSAG